jgi:hypothetical protein
MDVHWDEDSGGPNDPMLLGVYFENEMNVAMQVAKKYFDSEVGTSRFKDGTITDNTKTIGERGAVMSYDGIPSYGIAMDTFVLDENYVPVVDNDDDGDEYDEEEGDDPSMREPKAGDELNFGQLIFLSLPAPCDLF